MKTILIVDDDHGNLSSLKMLLKYAKKGVKVETAQSIDAAVKRLSRPGINLVLSDVNLDDGRGPDLKQKFPKLPFIYLTGDRLWKVPQGDPSGLLYKPYDIDDLLKAINKVLEESMYIRKAVELVSIGALHIDEAVNDLLEVSPPGFSGTVKAMKKHKDIDNPYALSWWMYQQGDKSHKKPEPDTKGIKNYMPPEEYARRKDGKILKFPSRKKRLVASLENE